MEIKTAIRQQILEKRSELDVLDWQKATEAITKEIIEHDWFREATDLYCYVDCKGEVGTRLIIEEAWRLGKSVWTPKVEKGGLSFYEVFSYDDLSPGQFGIMEPVGVTRADGIDGLVIVPGVAFDKQRNRIGYGKGYYDRYLLDHPGLHTIAVAFDMQVLDEVPYEETDIRPEVLITETITIGKEAEEC